MRLCDTHCHLGLDDVDEPTSVHARAADAGVAALLLVGIDAPTSQRARDLAGTLSGAAWSAGLHPNAAEELEQNWPELCELAAAPDCVAVGETGLDHHWRRARPEAQVASLQRHLDLAQRLDKPVILHCRDAFEPLLQVLAERAPLRGVMHCFSGGVAEARRALDLGLHLSFAAPLGYPRNVHLREAAAFAPEAALLLETDAPFLPPQDRRGGRNEPAFLLATARTLAALRGWSLEQVAAFTWRNAGQLFGWPEG